MTIERTRKTLFLFCCSSSCSCLSSLLRKICARRTIERMVQKIATKRFTSAQLLLFGPPKGAKVPPSSSVLLWLFWLSAKLCCPAELPCPLCETEVTLLLASFPLEEAALLLVLEEEAGTEELERAGGLGREELEELGAGAGA